MVGTSLESFDFYVFAYFSAFFIGPRFLDPLGGFGAPLAALPAIQSRLADAALATDSLTLVAWAAATSTSGLQHPELRWAGTVCCEVAATGHQVHGAVGFALESGVHVHSRRARSVQTWAVAVCEAV